MPHSGAPTVRRGFTLFVPLLTVAGFFLTVVVTSEVSSISQSQVDLDHLTDRVALEQAQILLSGAAATAQESTDVQVETGIWGEDGFRSAKEGETPNAVRATAQREALSLLNVGNSSSSPALQSEAIATYLPRKIVLIRHNLDTLKDASDVTASFKLPTLPGETLIETVADKGLERALLSGLNQLKTDNPNDPHFPMLVVLSGSSSPPLSGDLKSAIRKSRVPVVGISLSSAENLELLSIAKSTEGLAFHLPIEAGSKGLVSIINKISKTHPLQLVR